MYNLLEFFKLRTLVILQENLSRRKWFYTPKKLDTLWYLSIFIIRIYVYDMFNHASVYRTWCRSPWIYWFSNCTICKVPFKVYINMYWFASFDSPSLSTPLCVIDMAWDPELHTFFGRPTVMTIFSPSLLSIFCTAAVQLRPTLAPIVKILQLKFFQILSVICLRENWSCRYWILSDVNVAISEVYI